MSGGTAVVGGGRGRGLRARRLEAPRPRKPPTSNGGPAGGATSTVGGLNRSISCPAPADSSGALDALNDLEALERSLSSGNVLPHAVSSLVAKLKIHGPNLDMFYAESVDKAIAAIRKAIQDPNLGTLSRTYLLELLELSGSKWQHSPETEEYYAEKYNLVAFGNSPAKSSTSSSSSQSQMMHKSPSWPNSPFSTDSDKNKQQHSLSQSLGRPRMTSRDSEMVGMGKLEDQGWGRKSLFMGDADSGKAGEGFLFKRGRVHKFLDDVDQHSRGNNTKQTSSSPRTIHKKVNMINTMVSDMEALRDSESSISPTKPATPLRRPKRDMFLSVLGSPGTPKSSDETTNDLFRKLLMIGPRSGTKGERAETRSVGRASAISGKTFSSCWTEKESKQEIKAKAKERREKTVIAVNKDEAENVFTPVAVCFMEGATGTTFVKEEDPEFSDHHVVLYSIHGDVADRKEAVRLVDDRCKGSVVKNPSWYSGRMLETWGGLTKSQDSPEKDGFVSKLQDPHMKGNRNEDKKQSEDKTEKPQHVSVEALTTTNNNNVTTPNRALMRQRSSPETKGHGEYGPMSVTEKKETKAPIVTRLLDKPVQLSKELDLNDILPGKAAMWHQKAAHGIYEFYVSIPVELGGKVMGKAGCNIKKLQQISDTVMSMNKPGGDLVSENELIIRARSEQSVMKGVQVLEHFLETGEFLEESPDRETESSSATSRGSVSSHDSHSTVRSTRRQSSPAVTMTTSHVQSQKESDDVFLPDRLQTEQEIYIGTERLKLHCKDPAILKEAMSVLQEHFKIKTTQSIPPPAKSPISPLPGKNRAFSSSSNSRSPQTPNVPEDSSAHTTTPSPRGSRQSSREADRHSPRDGKKSYRDLDARTGRPGGDGAGEGRTVVQYNDLDWNDLDNEPPFKFGQKQYQVTSTAVNHAANASMSKSRTNKTPSRRTSQALSEESWEDELSDPVVEVMKKPNENIAEDEQPKMALDIPLPVDDEVWDEDDDISLMSEIKSKEGAPGKVKVTGVMSSEGDKTGKDEQSKKLAHITSTPAPSKSNPNRTSPALEISSIGANSKPDKTAEGSQSELASEFTLDKAHTSANLYPSWTQMDSKSESQADASKTGSSIDLEQLVRNRYEDISGSISGHGLYGDSSCHTESFSTTMSDASDLTGGSRFSQARKRGFGAGGRVGAFGYIQPLNICREPLCPFSKHYEVAHVENEQPGGPLSVKYRRQMFARRSALSLAISQNKGSKDSGDRLVYGTNFLLACARSPHAQVPPPDWTDLMAALPMVCLPKAISKEQMDLILRSLPSDRPSRNTRPLTIQRRGFPKPKKKEPDGVLPSRNAMGVSQKPPSPEPVWLLSSPQTSLSSSNCSKSPNLSAAALYEPPPPCEETENVVPRLNGHTSFQAEHLECKAAGSSSEMLHQKNGQSFSGDSGMKPSICSISKQVQKDCKGTSTFMQKENNSQAAEVRDIPLPIGPSLFSSQGKITGHSISNEPETAKAETTNRESNSCDYNLGIDVQEIPFPVGPSLPSSEISAGISVLCEPSNSSHVAAKGQTTEGLSTISLGKHLADAKDIPPPIRTSLKSSLAKKPSVLDVPSNSSSASVLAQATNITSITSSSPLAALVTLVSAPATYTASVSPRLTSSVSPPPGLSLPLTRANQQPIPPLLDTTSYANNSQAIPSLLDVRCFTDKSSSPRRAAAPCLSVPPGFGPLPCTPHASPPRHWSSYTGYSLQCHAPAQAPYSPLSQSAPMPSWQSTGHSAWQEPTAVSPVSQVTHPAPRYLPPCNYTYY